MAQPTPVLDLTTDSNREVVRIDGKSYPLRAIDDFSFVGYNEVAAKYEKVFARPSRTEADRRQRTRGLDELCRLVLDAPSSVHRKLSNANRGRILEVFSQVLRRSAERTGLTLKGRRANRSTSSSRA